MEHFYDKCGFQFLALLLMSPKLQVAVLTDAGLFLKLRSELMPIQLRKQNCRLQLKAIYGIKL